MRRCAVVLLLVILAGCVVTRGLPTPEPTQSPLPTPGPMIPQMYLPLMSRNHPVPLRGVAGGLWGMDADVFYHWSITPTEMDSRFARMVWCLTDYHLAIYEPQVVLASQRDYAAGIRGRVWLILNEPDQPSDNVIGGQCGAYPLSGSPFDSNNPSPRVHDDPEATARRFSAMYDLIKAYDPRARVFVGGIGWIGFPESCTWWTRFVNELAWRGELWKIEGVHVHAYPYGSFLSWGLQAFYDGTREWYEQYHAGLGLGARPIWITETGGGSCARWQRWDVNAWTTIRDETMIPLQAWMDSSANPGYDALFWFVSYDGLEASWWCNYLIDARQSPAIPTALGETWSR